MDMSSTMINCCVVPQQKRWVVVSNIFCFHPYLGRWSNLTHIFQMGWNHQPVLLTVQLQICRHWWRLDGDARWLTLRLPDYRERLELNNPGLAIQRLLETCLRTVNWKVDYLDGTIFYRMVYSLKGPFTNLPFGICAGISLEPIWGNSCFEAPT